MKKKVLREKKKLPLKAPSISQLSQQMEKIDCSHLVGKQVIEQQIVDLVRGKLDASYCQNWGRCGNGWGKCTPDTKAWIEKIKDLDIYKVLTPAERKVVEKLKIAREKI
ncbi:MAG: hypothetical protein GY710_06075 [Desulfobacteraceae bacterium]|nr:hypothetical protein [Desulfobacteraceae bacterium]